MLRLENAAQRRVAWDHPNIDARSEDQAATLAAAVAAYAADGRTTPVPEAIGDGLHALLYEAGSDGIQELTVAECTPTSITFLGVVIWVKEQTFAPVEAAFERGGTNHPVTRVTVKAGDGRVARRDAPGFPQSWRAIQRVIGARPTADEDWEYVVVYEVA